MPDQQHSPEPWRTEYRHIYAGEKKVALCPASRFNNDGCDLAEEDARRIVACVNFLSGVPTEQIERWVSAGLSMDWSDHGELHLIKVREYQTK